MSLSDEGNKRVNQDTVIDVISSPLYEQKVRDKNIDWSFWLNAAATRQDNFWYETPFYDMEAYRIRKAGLEFGLHEDFFKPITTYGADGALAARGDKFRNNRDMMMLRERLHLLQWSGLYRCMDIIAAHERITGDRFDTVMRVRDDGLALSKVHLPPFLLIILSHPSLRPRILTSSP